jgi:N-acetylglucosamine-6-phosphate deacetylase
MLIYGGQVFQADGQFRPCSMQILEDRIQAFLPPEIGIPMRGSAETFEATGCRIIPGLIDIHTHGCAGRDFCDGQPGALQAMGRYLVSQGVTTFLPASLSLPEEELADAFRQAAAYRRQNLPDRAEMAGIYMEGPFFAKEKKGIHNEACLIPVDPPFFERLNRVGNNLVRIVCIAPEKAGALDFIAQIKSRCLVAIAHTAADYNTAAAAFAAGATLVTHLFNDMNPLDHRQPGVPGAAFDHSAFVELIADGNHLHPAIVRSAFRLYGPDRVILISNATAACGLPDGEHMLSGRPVRVIGGEAWLPNGSLAGSTASLSETLRRAVSFGIPLADAIQAATINPARLLGLAEHIGSLGIGRQADLVVLDSGLQVVRVMRQGNWLT